MSTKNRILIDRPRYAMMLIKTWADVSIKELAEEIALGMAMLQIKLSKEDEQRLKSALEPK